jgi:hypothetical protein
VKFFFRFWLKYFKDNLELKSKPRDIFLELAKDLETSMEEKERLQSKYQKVLKENKSLHEIIQVAEVGF